MLLDKTYYGLRDITLETDALEWHAQESAAIRIRKPSGRDKSSFLKWGYDGKRLIMAYKKLHDNSKQLNTITPAGEELLDNFYILEKAILMLDAQLPELCIKRLPVCSEGERTGLPRVFCIAADLVGHREAKINDITLGKYLEGYQHVSPLSIYELNSIPNMLRLALIKLATMIAIESCSAAQKYAQADASAQLLIRSSDDSTRQAEAVFDKLNVYSDPSSADRLYSQLRDAGASAWLEQLEFYLEKADMDIDALMSNNRSYQAKNRVLLNNAIQSLRFIDACNWEDELSNLNVVEKILMGDKIYSQMDDASKFAYKAKLVNIAARLNAAEPAVARYAVMLANEGSGKAAHVGYYIIDDGKFALYQKIRPEKKFKKIKCSTGYSIFIYFQLLIALALLVLPGSTSFIAAILSIVFALTISNKLIAYITTRSMRNSFIPRLSLKSGIGESRRTIVLIPTLITSEKNLMSSIKNMETHYMANRHDNCFFAVLGDFKDASKPELPKENELLELAKHLTDELNLKYASGEPIFYYFHRQRELNKADNIWIGRERKRGAIMDCLNMLITGEDERFICMSDSPPPNLKYCVTLDADTILPPNTLSAMIGAMAHPLNEPELSGSGIVKKGYGVIQPRMVTTARSASKSRFARLISDSGGISVYDSNVSDIYQDMFCEGIFGGKGIFNIEIFNNVLSGRIADNSVLSHDMLEGSFVRAGFMGDVALCDGEPSNLISWWKRQHRWIRGDWQLLPYISKYHFDRTGNKIKNELSSLSKWKLFDNLRRSLLMPSFFIVMAVYVQFGLNPWCIALAFGSLFIEIIPNTIEAVIKIAKFKSKNTRITSVFNNLYRTLKRCIFELCIAPYSAYMTLDAIIRTLTRLYFTHNKMLEWQTAAQTEKIKNDTLLSSYIKIGICHIAGIWMLLGYMLNGYRLLCILLSAIWLCAPLVVWLLDKNIYKPNKAPDTDKLLQIAYATWTYFDTFCNEQTQFLPPDNFQEHPGKILVKNTSPTNIGMGITACINAFDLGFIDADELLSKLGSMCDTMERLEKWNGHLYNWYNLNDLSILRPKYVSTVDSGNLSACLLYAAHSLKSLDIQDETVIVSGLNCAINQLCTTGNSTEKEASEKLREHVNTYGHGLRLNELCKAITDTLKNTGNKGKQLTERAARILDNKKSRTTQAESRANELAARMEKLSFAMDFTALFDTSRNLFSIGYDFDNGVLSNSWYDLLASEARLSSLMAIASGQVPYKHWFRMGRLLTPLKGKGTLLSWSGTMFEYLMPVIFTGTVPGTLLDLTCKGAVTAQRRFRTARQMPWGVSESGFYAFDRRMFYQYKAFGTPELALQSMRNREMVIAPYATMLALMTDAEHAFANIEKLESMGALGKYGFYEALDFTKSRILNSKNGYEIVKSYMAHHQGMSLCALCNILRDNVIQKRFMDIPAMRGVSMLLEERRPDSSIIIREFESAIFVEDQKHAGLPEPKRTVVPGRAFPETQLLSNGNYTLFITDTGLGFSRCQDVLINVWEPDIMRSSSGIHFMLSDGSDVWSAALLPSNKPTEYDETILEPYKVTFTRRLNNISSKLEVCVAAGADAEFRKLTLVNHSQEKKTVDISAYFEVCMNSKQSFDSHPAFSKLFIDARLEDDILLFLRRPKPGDKELWMYCVLDGPSKPKYCTDRLVLPRRGRTLEEAAMQPLLADQPVNSPIEPGMYGRMTITLLPSQSARVNLLIGFAACKSEAVSKAKELLQDSKQIFETAFINIKSEHKLAMIKTDEELLFQRMAAQILLDAPRKKQMLAQSCFGIANLWKFGLSGDVPIILISISKLSQLETVKTLLKMSKYVTSKGISLDIVIIGEYDYSYAGELRLRLEDLIISAGARYGNVILLHGYDITKEDAAVLKAYSQLVLDAQKLLPSQISISRTSENNIKHYTKLGLKRSTFATAKPEIAIENGYGGFDLKTNEYVVLVPPKDKTPLPWSNVITNKNFGTLITESGVGFTWKENSRENRITPLYNDPVLDKKSEFILLCDDETADVWSIEPGRLQGESVCVVRHGFGYTDFKSNSLELEQHMRVFVDPVKPVKYYDIKLVNPMNKRRTISIMFCVEWQLGAAKKSELIQTYWQNGVLLAQNISSKDPDEYGFICAPGSELEFSTDKEHILESGWNAQKLNSRFGAGMGGFAAVRSTLVLNAGEVKNLVFAIGQDKKENIIALNNRFKPDYVSDILNDVSGFWDEKLHQIQVKTPELKFDILMNNWLLYQLWSSRLMGKTGYYQSSGAIGFRDQLQDALALMHSNPERVREQILVCAGRQFSAGDVLHWWHHPAQGVRTYISDDRLFLPYAVIEYIRAAGSCELLDEKIYYLEDIPIPIGKRDLYASFSESAISGTLYEHCVKAIDVSLKFGVHGLPLMGGGDWNDGMDIVGEGGGESVWLGWFLLIVLEQFAPLSMKYGDYKTADRFLENAQKLRTAIETEGWDGAWYKRAFFADKNLPALGSKESTQCSIDCISQVWAVFAGSRHSGEALDAVHNLLIDEENGLIKLLSPPFDAPEVDVGYIQTYLPGVRENGGQYTHAAAWTIIAECMLKRPDKAIKLFNLVNPISHGGHTQQIVRYKGEPYVAAGDVYSVGKNAGRAGWTWYTGSAGWLYRAGIEYILGLKRFGNELKVEPCTPWESFEADYRFGRSVYHITAQQANEKSIHRDGCPVDRIELKDDGNRHEILVKWKL